MTAIGTFEDCGECQGRGWLWLQSSGDWVTCTACDGTGSPGVLMPEVLTSAGRLERNVTMQPPRQPKPKLRLVEPELPDPEDA